MHIFTYGTLMVTDVFRTVTGKTYQKQKAVLEGYSRFRLAGKHYPGIVKTADDRVEGIVYLNITENDMAKLDEFEGDLYAREEVAVKLENGGRINATAYIVKKGHENCLSNEPWNLDEFIIHHLNDFLENDPGFLNRSR